MVERAHPDDKGFNDMYFGLKKNPYRAKLYERYQFCNQFIKNKDICDFPCGTGWGTSLLKGYKSVIGYDISEEAVTFAKKRFAGKKINFDVANMISVPLPEDSLDVLLCLEGFEHVEKEVGLKFLEECKRVVKRDGLIIMTCPVLNEFGNATSNPYHLNEYDEKELISLLNENFRIVKLDRLVAPDSPIYRIVLSNIKGYRYVSSFTQPLKKK